MVRKKQMDYIESEDVIILKVKRNREIKQVEENDNAIKHIFRTQNKMLSAY